MSHEEIVRAYRHLYRHGLRAIQFSKPARYTLRDRLRLVFRRGTALDYNKERLDNTLEFLRYATAENGLEHKIVKNLMFVWWHQDKGGSGKLRGKAPTLEEAELSITAFDTLNHTIHMLNESMEMCLPTVTSRDPYP